MRLIVVGDVHDHRERLAATLELFAGETADLVVLAGDVGRDPLGWRGGSSGRQQHDDSVRGVIAGVGEAFGGPVVFVPGNHDLRDPPADCGGINVDGRVETVAGLRIAGLGGAGPARFGFPYEWGEEDAGAMLAKTTEGVRAGELDVLLSHTPPAGTALDRIHRGGHVGSVAVAGAIERLRPRLFICGHIHEAWGVETCHEVPCLNAGALGEPFGQVLAWRVEWHRAAGLDASGGPASIESIRLNAAGTPERRDWPA